MTARQLLVLMNGRRCGIVEQADNKLSFTYDPAWPKDPTAVPLSLSMPLSKERHEHEIIDAFMWGLLPDNEITLDAWGKLHHVSARNCFALLGAVGQDCPGAIQFIPAEHIEEAKLENSIDWLEDGRFVKLIQELAANPGRGRSEISGGQFSLAGAQAKTALCRDGSRWGIPKGRSPTTHILKPLADQRDGQIENEHFCLRLAERLGFSVAESEVLDVGGIPVICSTRYDRPLNAKGEVVRLHQEDMCQALGVHPRQKYENEGGPGAARIFQLIHSKSSSPVEDCDRFLRALAYNLVIGGTDAHAKNYAFLIAPNGKIRLAPLYDVASYLPYMGKEKGIKLAMKIGDDYEMDKIAGSNWLQFARQAGTDERPMAHIRDLLMRLPGEALGLLKTCRTEGLKTPHLDTLIDALWAHCKKLAMIYGAEQLPSREA